MNEDIKRFPMIGDKFPSFDVQTTRGIFSLPSDFEGKWMILFSHPGDFSPVCTTEFLAFAKHNIDFKKLNARLVGLSIDQVYTHIKWIEWIKEKFNVDIPFPVIADDLGKISQRLGIIHPAKEVSTTRAVYIVDPKSIIRSILFYPNEIGRKIDEILRMLKALQIADANKVALPENWPENEVIGSKVILPPPKDIASSQQRINDEEGFDWWFIVRNLN